MVTPTVSIGYEGKPIDVLHRLIDARQKWLKESAKDAVIGTAILAVRSLRADTKKGKKKAKNSDIIVEKTGWVGGWASEGRRRWRCVRVSSAPGAHRVRGVRPVNLAGHAYEPGEKVKVYKVRPAHHIDDWKWTKNVNKADRCWYVLAKSEKVARDFGKRQVTRYMRRWGGLAKLALGFAMAKTSTRGVKLEQPASAKARVAADAAANIVKSMSDNRFTLVVKDTLDYAAKALRSGPGGVDRAMKKASNQIAGRIWSQMSHKLDRRLEPPFPDLVGKR